MSRKSYDASVVLDGKFWVIEVPEINRVTQARSLREAEVMAADLISIMTGEDPEAFDVVLTVNLPGHVKGLLALANHRREEAAAATASAAFASRLAADALAELGLSLRDIGVALGVSHQRAHQLVNEAKEQLAGEDLEVVIDAVVKVPIGPVVVEGHRDASIVEALLGKAPSAAVVGLGSAGKVAVPKVRASKAPKVDV